MLSHTAKTIFFFFFFSFSLFFLILFFVGLGRFVWDDLDGDGQQDAGEPGLFGISVTLKTCSNSVVGSTSSDATGAYVFDNVAPGCYKVLFAVPQGYVSTLPNNASDATDSDIDRNGETGSITLVAGTNDYTVGAGFALPSGCYLMEIILIYYFILLFVLFFKHFL